MTQDNRIKKWSNLLLDKLLEYRQANPGFTFAVRQVNRNQRLDKGYWFQGDENYIFVGFTARGDASNKTRSVGLAFTDITPSKANCWLEIVFKTEPRKDVEQLYRDFIAGDSSYTTIDQPYYKDYKYFKGFPTSDPVENLERFLNEDWQKLSAEVKKRNLEEVFFVPEQDFLQHLNRIEVLRGRPLHRVEVQEAEVTHDAIPEVPRSEEANQLEIPVLIEEQEFMLLLLAESNSIPNNRIWRGEVEEYSPTPWVEFVEVNGTISNLKHAQQLDAFRDILFERLNDALRGLREEEMEGVEVTETGEISEQDRDLILDPYNPDDIKVRSGQFPVFQIFDMIKKKDIDLNPDFQRHLVWDMKRKSRLIESTLLGIPLPVFYFSQDKDGVFHVVDGLQRLTTIRDFMSNRFFLRNLEHLKMCEGRYFEVDENVKETKALERRFQRRIEQTQLSVNIIESSSPPKVKYDIFRRINEGGKPLNQQEIRNSLAKPHTRKLMRDMVYSEAFVLATNGNIDKMEPGISDQRMGAQEMTLRFVGFCLEKQGKSTYLGDMNSFLDDTLDKINAMSEKELNDLREQFLRAMRNCHHLFGQYCFRKCLSPHLLPGAPRQLINKSLFTTWSVATCDIPLKNVKKLDFGVFSKILANELDKKEEYYTVVTLRTNDRRYLESAFNITEQLITENI